MPENFGQEAEPQKIVYNKLVRDRIPDIIVNDGATCDTRVLKQEEYIAELTKKLTEEVAEFGEASDREDQIEELADVAEVTNSLMQELKIKPEEIESVRVQRREARGGFDKKIFLISTEGGSYGK